MFLKLLPILVAFGSIRIPLPGRATAQLLHGVCETRDGKASHSGQIVRVRGEVTEFYGGLFLRTDECNYPILIVLPDGVTPKPEFKLQRDASYNRFDKASRQYKSSLLKPKWKIVASLQGRLDWAFDVKDGKPVYEPQGFGHSGMGKWRLVLQSVSDVVLTKIK